MTSNVRTLAESLKEHIAAISAGADLYLPEAAAMTSTILCHHIERLVQVRATAQHAGARATMPRGIERWDPAEGAAERGSRSGSPRVVDIFALPTAPFRNESGRLDAERIARDLGVALSDLAQAVDVPYKTVHRTPDSQALQPRLAPFANVLAMLFQTYSGDRQRVLAWLQSPQPALGGQTPQQALLKPGGADGVEQFVTGAWLGEGE